MKECVECEGLGALPSRRVLDPLLNLRCMIIHNRGDDAKDSKHV